MNEDIEKVGNQVSRLTTGEWYAVCCGELVTEPDGEMMLFDNEADAWAYLEQRNERDSAVDS